MYNVFNPVRDLLFQQYLLFHRLEGIDPVGCVNGGIRSLTLSHPTEGLACVRLVHIEHQS